MCPFCDEETGRSESRELARSLYQKHIIQCVDKKHKAGFPWWALALGAVVVILTGGLILVTDAEVFQSVTKALKGVKSDE